MALQEEGWPLGLRLLTARIELVRNGDFSASVSFSTMLTASSTPSADSSSDLDSQSKQELNRKRKVHVTTTPTKQIYLPVALFWILDLLGVSIVAWFPWGLEHGLALAHHALRRWH